MKTLRLLLTIAGLSVVAIPFEHARCDEVGAWTFAPKYILPQKAANHPGPFPAFERPDAPFLRASGLRGPLELFGLTATHREDHLIDRSVVPGGAFTLELWVLDHVNRPVAASVGVLSSGMDDGWILAWHDRTVIANLATEGRQLGMDPLLVSLDRDDLWKKWWAHLVLRFDGSEMDLLVNGKKVASREVKGPVRIGSEADFEITAFLANEREMDLENIVREVRLHDEALDDDVIREHFDVLTGRAVEGVLSTEVLHFNAGPYLHFVTTNSVQLSWETSRPTTATVRYGTSVPPIEEIRVDSPARIHDLKLENLGTATNYYYEIVAKPENGDPIWSGMLTFKTAVEPETDFLFAVVGDTESRPHINDAIAKGIWSHRPNFVINLGDLTDGGQEAHKYEWNFEYFAGMTQLHSRVPVFTVPGNGESDLHWYRRYHHYPGAGNYYTFNFGSAQFFMLDSNRRIAPGTDQYAWLDQALRSSEASWKFVCHHHCAYSSDEDDYGDTWTGEEPFFVHENVAQAIPLYEKHGVDVVFYGHVHAFERSRLIRGGKLAKTEGVIYVESGGGGGNLEDSAPFPSWFSNSKFRGHHYCVVRVSEDVFDFQMIDLDGVVRDRFTIEK